MISLLEFCRRAGIAPNHQKIILQKYRHIDNYFQFNPGFYMQANHIGVRPEKHYHDIGIVQSRIFHPRQLQLYYPSARLYEEHGIWKVDYEEKTYYLAQFCNEYIYNKSTASFLHDYVTIIDNTAINCETVTLLTIGNYDIASEMIQQLEQTLQNTCVVITYYEDPSPAFLDMIQAKFPNRLILKTLNLGSDIQPAMIAYCQIARLISFNFVLKLHTKSSPTWRHDLISMFHRQDGIDSYIAQMKNPMMRVGMIGSKHHIESTRKQRSNLPFLRLMYHKPVITPFIAGTIFLCKRYVFDQLLTREEVIRAALFQPFYYNYRLFHGWSPVHAMEQMFGAEVTLCGERIGSGGHMLEGLKGLKRLRVPMRRMEMRYRLRRFNRK